MSKTIEGDAGLVIETPFDNGGKTIPKNMQSSGRGKKRSSAQQGATSTTLGAGESEARSETLRQGKDGSLGFCLVTLPEINSSNSTSETLIAPIARNMFPQDSARLTIEVLTMLFRGLGAADTQSPIWLSRAALATLRNQTLEANAALIVQAVNSYDALLGVVGIARLFVEGATVAEVCNRDKWLAEALANLDKSKYR